jgi:uncharacterized coiled-coil protein SlyX
MSRLNEIKELKVKLKENELMIEALNLLIDKQKLVLQNMRKELLSKLDKSVNIRR